MCIRCEEEALVLAALLSDTGIEGVDVVCAFGAYMEGVLCPAAPIQTLPEMDFQGQQLAERLMLYIICFAGLVAFCMGWLEGSFALMMKVRAIPIDCFAVARSQYGSILRTSLMQ